MILPGGWNGGTRDDSEPHVEEDRAVSAWISDSEWIPQDPPITNLNPEFPQKVVGEGNKHLLFWAILCLGLYVTRPRLPTVLPVPHLSHQLKRSFSPSLLPCCLPPRGLCICIALSFKSFWLNSVHPSDLISSSITISQKPFWTQAPLQVHVSMYLPLRGLVWLYLH